MERQQRSDNCIGRDHREKAGNSPGSDIGFDRIAGAEPGCDHDLAEHCDQLDGERHEADHRGRQKDAAIVERYWQPRKQRGGCAPDVDRYAHCGVISRAVIDASRFENVTCQVCHRIESIWERSHSPKVTVPNEG